MKIFSQVLLLFLMLFLVLIQVSFFAGIGSFAIVPNLLLSLLFATSLVSRFENVLTVTFVSGLLYDLLTMKLLGTDSLFFLTTGSLVFLLRKRVSTSILLFLFLFFISSVSYRALFVGNYSVADGVLGFGLDLFFMFLLIPLVRVFRNLTKPSSSKQLKFKEVK